MKKAIALAFVLSLGLSLSAAAEQVAPAAQAQPYAATLEMLEAVLTPQAVQPAPTAVPYCGAYDGNPCTSPGARFRCQWIPTEPGICVCTSAYVWHCG